jgi:hypothetical protein
MDIKKINKLLGEKLMLIKKSLFVLLIILSIFGVGLLGLLGYLIYQIIRIKLSYWFQQRKR